MKKKFLSLLLLPLVLTSCGSKGVSFAALKAQVDTLGSAPLYPYYRVIGSLDFNNEVLEVDATFDKTPSTEAVVPYARYNAGFYNARLDESEDAVIYGTSSRSYWLRAPLRVTKDNFYVLDDEGQEASSDAHYILSHIITSYMNESGAINPPTNKIIYELHDDGSFSYVGEKVHTEFKLDNYPYYPDPAEHPELGDWDEDNPLPCYNNKVNAKVNVRFDYNKDGWLVKESLSSIEYNYNNSTASQIALVAVYNYKFA